MSQTIGYFFNHDASIAELATEVEIALGTSLVRVDDSGAFRGRLLGVEFSLYQHEFVNDCGIPFESHQFCAATRTSLPDGDLRPLQITIAAAIPYLLFRSRRVAGILIFDLPHLIATYDVRIDDEATAVLINAALGEEVGLADNYKYISERLPSRAFTTEAESSIDEYLRIAGSTVR